MIVNWNAWSHTLAAARSVDQADGCDVRLFIVDNASKDSSVARLRRSLPDVTIIASPINAGFAGGANIGMQAALATGCDYLFLLNNDATLDAGALVQLVEASRGCEDRAVLGCAVRYKGGAYQFMGSNTHARHGLPTWFEHPKLAEVLQKPYVETDFVLGAAFFVPAGIVMAVGLFDERFYLNYEETDFCYRARAAGYACYVIPPSQVQHEGSATVGPSQAPLQAYFLARNELLFVDLHGAWMHKLGVRIHRMRMIWRTIRERRISNTRPKGALEAMLRGVIDYHIGRFGNCPERIRHIAGLRNS